MTHDDAIAKLNEHAKPGYSIRTIRNRHDAFTTHYLLSHKNRAVGAIAICDDGETVIAESPRNALDWFNYNP